jgi:hypothetical protein
MPTMEEAAKQSREQKFARLARTVPGGDVSQISRGAQAGPMRAFMLPTPARGPGLVDAALTLCFAWRDAALDHDYD